jgi:putative phosphoesterase
MKIGVISDTHIRTMTFDLEKVILKHFSDVDMIFHAGDVVEMEVLHIFQSKKLYLVAGNMDSSEIKGKNPWKRVLKVGNFKIGMIHGWGSPSGMEQRIQGEFENVDCIVFGHTHNPCNRMIGKTLFFNPGSPTDKRFANVNTLGVLMVNDFIKGEIIYL